MIKFKKGELVVFKTHPFINSFTNIKITGYSDYTSPVLVVKEVKEGTFDKVTGKNIGLQLNCQYYNSKDGKFIEKWINSNLVQKIDFSISSHKILFNLDLKSDLEDLKKETTIKNYEEIITNDYINRKVVLKSVDIELNKVKVNRVKEDGKLTETNHLEFLPPIMTIIGYKLSDDKNKFCEKSGLPFIELKCKWYNSSSKNFSESYFSFDILYLVKETQDLYFEKDLLSDITESIEENPYFILPLINQFQLEGNTSMKKIINTIGHSESILFKHYFYQMTYFDYITQKGSTITIDDEFKKINENNFFGKKFPNYDKGYKLKVSDCKFKKDNYYWILYKDSFNNITRRIVKLTDLILFIKDIDKMKKTYPNLKTWMPDENALFVEYDYLENGKIYISMDNGESVPENTLPKTIFDDEDIEIVLGTNCLLRKGKKRNFKLNRILEVHEIIDGYKIFENQ